jgi:hypothetical protein
MISRRIHRRFDISGKPFQQGCRSGSIAEKADSIPRFCNTVRIVFIPAPVSETRTDAGINFNGWGHPERLLKRWTINPNH